MSWGSLSDERGQIESYTTPSWNPIDDDLHVLNLSNIYWTLPENKGREKFVFFYTDFYTGYYRNIQINYENNLHENIVNPWYPVFFLYTTPKTRILMRNNRFNNVSTQLGGTYLVTNDQVVIENEVFENSAHIGFDIYAVLNTNEVIMNNITIRNVNGTEISTNYYLYIRINEGGNITVNGLNFEGSNIYRRTGFFVNGHSHTITLNQLKFDNVDVGAGNSLVTSGTFRRFQMTNSYFSNIRDVTSDDQNNYMLAITNIDLKNALDSVIQNVTIQNSTIGFLHFNSISGTTSQRVNFNITNIIYSNCRFQNEENLLRFSNIESQEDLKFTLDDLTFQNITFTKYGNMLLFQQQMKNRIELINSSFSLITAGVIHIEATNKQNGLLNSEVLIANSTFKDIDSNFNSLILVKEGGRLEISNSTFTGIFCLEEGGVLFAGFQRSETIIRNSVFTNNTSVEGGVFNVEFDSVIKIYDSLISLNFAVVGGVIQANNNGYFEIYNTTVKNNYAVSSSVSEIFDVARQSLISNSVFQGNVAIPVQTLLRELTVVWNLLWFLPKKFKEYLVKSNKINTVKPSNNLFQLIRSNLVVEDGSEFTDCESIIDSYVSSVTFRDSTFSRLSSVDNTIKIVASTLNITNWEFKNITTADQSELMKVAFESTLNIDGLIFRDSTLPFIELLSSTANIKRFEEIILLQL